MDYKAIFKHSDFNKFDTAIIGVSGGSDSLALLLLFSDYVKYLQSNNLHNPKIIAVTIDHKLRKEAKLEAEFVKNICSKNNIEHHIIEWDGSQISSNISAQARFNRYKILYDVARKYTKPIILVAHNLNDRIETFLMRKKRQSIRGLATIAPLSLLFNNIYLWRPLLNITKTELQAYLKNKKQNWIEDPSNINLKYERAVTRKNLGNLNIVDIEKWINLLSKYEYERVSFNSSVAKILQNLNIYFIGECLCFSFENTLYQNNYFMYFTVGILASIMGGSSYAPNQAKLILIEELFTSSLKKINICGAVIEKKQEGNQVQFAIWRENRNIYSAKCKAGQKILWDNRYKIVNNSKKPITARIINKKELKDFAKKTPSLYMHNTSLIIEQENKKHIIFFPAINKKKLTTKLPELEIQKHISIYNWLVTGFDFEIYKRLKIIFL